MLDYSNPRRDGASNEVLREDRGPVQILIGLGTGTFVLERSLRLRLDERRRQRSVEFPIRSINEENRHSIRTVGRSTFQQHADDASVSVLQLLTPTPSHV